MLIPDREAAAFSLAEARAIVRDLFVPRQSIYWIDFLATMAVGYGCLGLTRWLVEAAWQAAALRWGLAALGFAVQCVCFYRGVMFVHEVVHLPERKFVAFRVIWNLVCGIPFLVPSFTYYTHLD